MKKFTCILLLLALTATCCGCAVSNQGSNPATPNSSVTLALGSTYDFDGIRFTLNQFCFAKKTDYETYDPNMIDGASWSPNDGYIFGYLNYTIHNGAKETFNHFLNMDITLVYGDGFTYGTNMTDYKVACTETNKYNLDIDPLMNKTYHHIISNCPTTISKPTSDIKIEVEINGKKVTYVIPPSSVKVNEGQEAPREEISFTKADKATTEYVINKLIEAEYTWYNGSIKCTLTFTRDEVRLTQRIAGQDYIATGTYVVGTDKIKANYGQDDVFYGWADNGGALLEITIINN